MKKGMLFVMVATLTLGVVGLLRYTIPPPDKRAYTGDQWRRNYDSIEAFVCVLHGDTLARVRKGKLWGYINKAGREVVAPLYKRLGYYYGSRALVQHEGHWGWVDAYGRLTTEMPVADEPDYYLSPYKQVDQLAVPEGWKRVCVYEAMSNSTWGLLNAQGIERVYCQYDGLGDFINGLAKVKRGGLYGMIDTTGKEVVPVQFSHLGDMWGAWTEAVYDKKRGIVDRNGRFIKREDYLSVGAFFHGVAKVELTTYKCLYINEKGEESREYDQASPLCSGYGAVSCGYNECGAVDAAFRQIIPCIYQRVNYLSDGMIGVKNQGLWGFADTTGKFRVPFKYKEVEPFYRGFAMVSGERGWGVIDKNGREVLPLIYGLRELERWDGCIWVREQAGGWRLVRLRDKKELLPPAYNLAHPDAPFLWKTEPSCYYLEHTPEAMGVFQQSGAFGSMGFVDTLGKVRIPFLYAAAHIYSSEGTLVRRISDGKWLWVRDGGEDVAVDYTPVDGFKCTSITDGVMLTESHKLHDAKGSYVKQLHIYAYSSHFSEGLALCKRQESGAKTGAVDYVDTNGNIALETTFDKGHLFREGRAAVGKANQDQLFKVNYDWTYIDRRGIPLYPTMFDEAGEWDQGIAYVKIDDIVMTLTPNRH